MDGAFGRAGAARRVSPEAYIVFARRFSIKFGGGFIDETLVGKRLASGLADNDDMFKKAGVVPYLFNLRQSRFMNDDRPRPAVVDPVVIICGGHPRISRNGNGADLDGAKETEGEFRGIGQNQEHPVLNLNTEFFKGVAGAINFVEKLLISEGLILVVDRRTLAPSPCDIRIHEGRGGVVNIREFYFHVG